MQSAVLQWFPAYCKTVITTEDFYHCGFKDMSQNKAGQTLTVWIYWPPLLHSQFVLGL